MDRTRNQHLDDADAPLDMSRLRKIALWGTAAAAFLSVAVLVGMSDTGKQRMSVAVASWSKQDRPDIRLAGNAAQPAPAPIIVQRDLEAMGEARRLAESVRSLTADRDRLVTRLSALERNFEDVTGSIKREISATRPTPPQPSASQLPPIDLPSMADKPGTPPASTPATTAAKTQSLPKIASNPPPEPEPPPAQPVAAMPAFLPPAAEPAPAPAPPVVIAAVPAPAKPSNAMAAMAPLDPSLVGGPDAGIPSFGLPGMPALPLATVTAPEPAQDVTASAPTVSSATSPRIEFGVDIGGASNIEMIRAQWSMIRAQHPKAFEGLIPVVSVRDLRQRRTVELRLVVGPLRNANTAAELCAALNAAGLPSCQPAVFDGQRLALR